MPAARSPRRSASERSVPTLCTGASAVGVQWPKRGATTRSVTYHASGTIRTVMPAMKVPVAGDVHLPAGNQQLRGRLGDAEQQRVELARQQVGGEPAGDAGEGRGDADDRVPPAAAKSAPPSGIITTKAASPAWLAITEAKITIGVSHILGALATAARIAAPARPVCSRDARAEHDQQT